MPWASFGKEEHMVANSIVVPTIPVTDLDASLRFYRDVLGLTVLEETPFAVRYGAGAGTQLSTYKRAPVERGHTVAHFEVADIEAAVAEIRSRGGVFEEYSGGALTTVNGIAQMGPVARGAWLKDPDGNVIGLRQGPMPAR
jgi:catechol 2,3-dioxygenase-like lactoylglutathione lyase family enzyme